MTITQETLGWVFKDPEWKNKFLIGSALILATSFIPVIGLVGYFTVYGYALVIMREVMRGESPTLPKWDNLVELTLDGLKAGISGIGYMLPGLLAFVCGFLLLYGTMLGGILTSTVTSSRVSNPNLGLIFAAGSIGFACLFMLGTVAIFVGSLLVPLAVTHYAKTGQISAGYRVKELWTILRANVGGFLIAWVFYHGLGIALSYALIFAYLTIILCFFLPVIMAPFMFYFALMYATLFGAAYREGIAKTELVAAT